ncbi:MAG TPA: hypothetical protein VNV65_11130 [Candidatus Solibacter sp.]|jgi:hypothetical protein|nr:hypothetical protein [Candidatus Solibacter sp.]
MTALARLASAAAILAAVAATGAASVRAASPAASLTLVGQSSLGSRGMSAALTLAGGCAYIGSRTDAAPLVVDISNPASPQVVGHLTAHSGSTPRELRAIPANRELVVLNYAINGGPNGLDIYQWTADCRSPKLTGHYDFRSHVPHEFYLWQDPQRPARFLAFVTMFASVGNALNVVDVSSPAAPSLVGGWSAPSSYGYAPLHSIALTPDGRTAYLSLWTGGLVVADSSDFATAAASPSLRLLTSAGARFKTPPGNVHSAVPVPGRSLVVTTDERYPTPYGQGCPFGPAHVVDVSNPAQPVALATMSIAENNPSSCSAAGSGTWTSHNPTLTAHLALISWYSGGLQVFALDDPANPALVASARPSGVSPTLRDIQLGTTASMTWSYPVIAGGLIYVGDINQGLLVYRYQGPHQDEIQGAGFAEGNSNLTATTTAATATPSTTATQTPARGNAPVAGAKPDWRLPIALATLLVVTVAAAAIWRRRGT